MSINESSDPAESASLTPAESLIEWRKERDEQRYRRWCEDSFGMIEVGPEVIHPAEVLDACRADAARRGRDEVRASSRADVEDKVCERFPAPIAVPFNSFLHGSLDPLKRLLHMRDSWEGLIHLLAALTLAECVSTGVAFGGFCVRNSEANVPKPCNRGDLKTNSLALRIGLIEGALERARTIGLPISMLNIIPRGTVQEIRRLNAVRNEFSHEAVKSDKQAEEIIADAYPLFREILVDLVDLEQVELLRLRTLKPGLPLRAEAERLQGYAQGRRVKEVTLNASSSMVAMTASPVGTYDRVLAATGDELIDLSPFFYAFEDDSGRRTHIGFFKFNKGGKWNIEIVGESKSVDDADASHEALMARFYELLKRDDPA